MVERGYIKPFFNRLFLLKDVSLMNLKYGYSYYPEHCNSYDEINLDIDIIEKTALKLKGFEANKNDRSRNN